MSYRKVVLSRGTEYCTELYNHDNADPPSPPPPPKKEDLQPILREEVEFAEDALKKGKREKSVGIIIVHVLIPTDSPFSALLFLIKDRL